MSHIKILISYSHVILFCFTFLFGCGEKDTKEKQKENYYLQLQGPWQGKNEIYYIKGDSESFFSGRFYSGTYDFKNDTVERMSMLNWYGKGVILNISKDSLFIRNIENGKVMKFNRPTLAALQRDTLTHKPDSVISITKKKVFENVYDFDILAEYEDHIFLKVQRSNCKDSCLKLEHMLWLRAGDCNGTSKYEAVFEVIKDKLIFYIDDTYVEHFDDTNPHSSSDYLKETYFIRKNGQIVRVKTEYGKKDPEIEKEIINKIAELSLRK